MLTALARLLHLIVLLSASTLLAHSLALLIPLSVALTARVRARTSPVSRLLRRDTTLRRTLSPSTPVSSLLLTLITTYALRRPSLAPLVLVLLPSLSAL